MPEPLFGVPEGRIAMPVMNDDIVARATQNEAFRREVVTGDHSQVVVMTIPPGGEIGEEVHDHVDQVLVFVQGDGEAIIAGESSAVRANGLAFVPAGTRHNFRNTGSIPLRLFTVYAPPEHPAGTVHQTKFDADAAEERP
jgi:mannose-6-phosphate isomerase-like protein (cupin superfamily)